jgi:CHASE2 domain-containing sensor protein
VDGVSCRLKSPRALIACSGAAIVGVGAGYLVAHGWLPWEGVLGALVLGVAYGSYKTRDNLRLALAAKAKQISRKSPGGQ